MAINVAEITSVLKKEIENFEKQLEVTDVGTVIEVGDGIARIYGLRSARAGELLEFENGVMGQVFNLEEESIGAVIFGNYLEIEEGDSVRSTGRLLEVPVGDAVVGRVINPLGQPLDGGPPLQVSEYRKMDIVAPGIAERQPVKEPLQTGLKAIDSMIPIGRGQRELIIGDRKTGKTAIAIDTIINQRGGDVICVYVAIGQKESTVAALVEVLRDHHAMDYTIVVVASASDPAPLQYIAPYAGCAMAEYFMYEHGRATLCIYDDLSKQAQAYRQLSLLLRRPPGREAYPGDVFYLHSRLLERSCKLAERRVIVKKGTPEGVEEGVNGRVYVGVQDLEALQRDLEQLGRDTHEVRKIRKSGGSLTALPVIETLEGEVSAYIPTNVISITDGQIYLEPDLFFAGVRPAINVGISVSRVGGNAQIKSMKKVAGTLKLDQAQYRELEAFAKFGSDLDAATQAILAKGARNVEILKQPQYSPMPVEKQIAIIYLGTNNLLRDVPLDKVREFEEIFLIEMEQQLPHVLEEFRQGKLEEASLEQMRQLAAKLTSQYKK